MSFSDLYGHSRQIAMLQKTIALRRVAHAYLFSGLSGIGKKTLALAFAQALNCEQARTHPHACGQCPACRKIASRTHPDIHVMSTDRQFLRIDAVRDIQRQMTFRPLEARLRVVIIDDADKMNEQAANALLKTLEEPTSSNLLILITARPYWLPQTIISRCRHLRFNPLPAETVERFLIETRQTDAVSARLWARLCQGSISTAMDLQNSDYMSYRSELARLLAMARDNDPQTLLNLAVYLEREKNDARQGLRILKSFLRDALVYGETADNKFVVNVDQSDLISDLAARTDGEKLLGDLSVVERAAEALEMNVNKSLTLETMAFKLRL